MNVTPDLPPSLRLAVRHPTLDDVEALTDLVNASDQVDYGTVWMVPEEMRDELARVDLGTDAWIVEADDSAAAAAVAFGALTRRGPSVRWDVTLTVRPGQRGQGIGTALARALEGRAREHVPEAPSGVSVGMRAWIKGGSQPARRWAEGLGFNVQREVLRMRIEMTEPPPAAEWPAGITVRSFVPGRDERATFEALEEAFSDHWGHIPNVFEDWVTRTQAESFEPDLALLATEGDEIIATSFGSVELDGGWVSALGTRRAWRRHGVARAILLETFRRFWDQGVSRVALGVDSQSLTGATRLYERAGMRIVERYDQLSKVLRPGLDPTTTPDR
ncbi:MAG: GNAT family N-acetyltransferase [Chloroflexota bacterium]|nr:GNAT family N-acetyltransferase [Chloroflexota bacterium]